MQPLQTWIWQQADWPEFRWDQGALLPILARARLAQGKILGVAEWLHADLTLEAMAAILVEDGITTSAIEGEPLDPGAVRSSVARHLGLPTAGPAGFVGGLNTRKYMSFNKTSRATAYRELADLVGKGCLAPGSKGGRSSGYDIAWPADASSWTFNLTGITT